MTEPSANTSEHSRSGICGLPWYPWSPHRTPSNPVISRAKQSRVWDIDEREYLDASSLSLTCGYAHPRVIAAVSDQLGRIHGLDLSAARHLPVAILAERIGSVLPETLTHTLFLNSGSEAIEAALFMSFRTWRLNGESRNRVITMERGYHGSTLLTRSLSGLAPTSHDMSSPFPVTRIKLDKSGAAVRTPQACNELLDRYREAFKDGSPPAAVVIEPLLNVGGGIVLPPHFLRGLRDLCTTARTHLIVDEVFTGWARTGRMFGWQYDGAVPDILITSKGLGGGYVPISSVTATQDIYSSIKRDPVFGGLRYGHTTSGHAGACAAALAVLDVIDEEGLATHADREGRRLLNALEPLASRGDNVVDVRGLGLISVIETDSPDTAAALVKRARSHGLLLRQQMSSVYVVPPVNVTTTDLDSIIERLTDSVVDHG